MSRSVPGGAPPEWPEPEPERGPGRVGEQGGRGNGYDSRRGDPDATQSYGPPYSPQYGYGHDQYGQYGGPPYSPDQGARGTQGYGPPQPPGPARPGGAQSGGRQYSGPQSGGPGYNGYGPPGPGQPGYNGQASEAPGPEGPGWGYADTQRQPAPGQYADAPRYQGQGQGPGDPSRPGGRRGQAPGRRPPGGKVRLRRTRGFFRRRVVRVISALLAVFLVLVLFSAGQTAFRNNGQGFSANLAEWARDHYLGPVVTFGEWLSYNPPRVGGKPSISLRGGGQALTPVRQSKGRHKGFVPDIPGTLKPLASGGALAGEGQWSAIEKVKGEPAILTTRLRDGGLYTSYVNGVASIDQRLVRFSLRPGTEDPGAGNWGAANYIPAGSRRGLLATFNGGFKLDSAGGGFYLNGIYHGSLVTGAASVVYYKNGTIKVGKWGRDFTLNRSIVGVRQNLRLLIDRGKISPNLNQDIQSKFGATLGGGYYVWRSGLGITRDGRIIYVYGEKLNVQDLADLLARAGAVEGMQMDINPAWMKFDYYSADGNPGDPKPTPLLPTQQADPFSYYTPSTRDFTAVYAR